MQSSKFVTDDPCEGVKIHVTYWNTMQSLDISINTKTSFAEFQDMINGSIVRDTSKNFSLFYIPFGCSCDTDRIVLSTMAEILNCSNPPISTIGDNPIIYVEDAVGDTAVASFSTRPCSTKDYKSSCGEIGFRHEVLMKTNHQRRRSSISTTIYSTFSRSSSRSLSSSKQASCFETVYQRDAHECVFCSKTTQLEATFVLDVNEFILLEKVLNFSYNDIRNLLTLCNVCNKLYKQHHLVINPSDNTLLLSSELIQRQANEAILACYSSNVVVRQPRSELANAWPPAELFYQRLKTFRNTYPNKGSMSDIYLMFDYLRRHCNSVFGSDNCSSAKVAIGN